MLKKSAYEIKHHSQKGFDGKSPRKSWSMNKLTTVTNNSVNKNTIWPNTKLSQWALAKSKSSARHNSFTKPGSRLKTGQSTTVLSHGESDMPFHEDPEIVPMGNEVIEKLDNFLKSNWCWTSGGEWMTWTLMWTASQQMWQTRDS